jgi:nicotinate-nucleotide adenylyltransferase
MDFMIGVFGGTFDPPHLAHVVLADEACHTLNLEKVLWVLTAQPPHKPNKPISPVDHRLSMVEIVTRDDENFELSRADLDREPPYYAIGTLSWLRKRYPGEEFAYLMGSDSLRDLPNWHKPKAFVDACDCIGVMKRPGAQVDLQKLESALPDLRGKLDIFNVPILEISGREIRKRVSAGEPYRYFLLPEVYNYIQVNKLYQ